MQTIKLLDGTVLQNYGGSSENRLMIIVDNPEPSSKIYDALSVKNLSRFEFIDSLGSVTATYFDKEVHGAEHIKHEDVHVMSVKLKDVDKVTKDTNELKEKSVDTETRTATLETTVDELLISLVESVGV